MFSLINNAVSSAKNLWFVCKQYGRSFI